MMRYQRPNSECFPLSNGRKPNTQPSIKPAGTTTITTYREHNHHPDHNPKHHHHHDHSGSTTRIPNFESTKPTPCVRSAIPNTSTTSPDGDFPPFPTSTTPEPISTTAKPKNHHDTNGLGAETTLPQWGHNKRSRGSRAENRMSGDDSSPGNSRQLVKIQRRSITVMMEKQPSTATIAPPYSRGANLRSCTVSRDSSAIFLSRNVEERSNNGVSRSEKKRQQNNTSPQKMHKPSSTTHHHRQNNTFTSSASPAGRRGVGVETLNHSSTPSSEKETTTTATPPVAAMAGTTTTTEKLNLDLFEWPRIYLSLSRKEKEDDFLAMKGTKLPQRPKKRAKNIDKSLQYCFPGMWLSDLTRGRYEVREKKRLKKKRRGLKGLESMDSDSD